jgi:hypothetical protein
LRIGKGPPAPSWHDPEDATKRARKARHIGLLQQFHVACGRPQEALSQAVSAHTIALQAIAIYFAIHLPDAALGVTPPQAHSDQCAARRDDKKNQIFPDVLARDREDLPQACIWKCALKPYGKSSLFPFEQNGRIFLVARFPDPLPEKHLGERRAH